MKTNILDLSFVQLEDDNLVEPSKKNIVNFVENIKIKNFLSDLNIHKISAYKDNEEKEFLIEEFLKEYKRENFDWYASNINIYDNLELKLPSFLKSWTYYLPTEIELKWLWLFIGPSQSHTTTHIDTMNSGAWNLLLEGTKEWTFYSPNSSISKELLPQNFKSNYEGEKKEISIIQNKGELIYTPSSWSHKVCNITPTISITGNFINKTNIEESINYMNCKKEMNWYEILKYLNEKFK